MGRKVRATDFLFYTCLGLGFASGQTQSSCLEGRGFTNFLAHLPRVDSHLHSVSGDLGTYDILSCPDERPHCKLADISPRRFLHQLLGILTGHTNRKPTNTGDVGAYFQALAVWIFLGIVLALLSILSALALPVLACWCWHHTGQVRALGCCRCCRRISRHTPCATRPSEEAGPGPPRTQTSSRREEDVIEPSQLSDPWQDGQELSKWATAEALSEQPFAGALSEWPTTEVPSEWAGSGPLPTRQSPSLEGFNGSTGDRREEPGLMGSRGREYEGSKKHGRRGGGSHNRDSGRMRFRKRVPSPELAAMTLTTFCVLMILIAAILGMSKGAAGLRPAFQQAALQSPTRLVQLVRSGEPPVQEFVLASAGIFGATLEQLNQTVTAAINLRQLASDIVCAEGWQVNSFPDGATLLSALMALKEEFDGIPDGRVLVSQLDAVRAVVRSLQVTLPRVMSSINAVNVVNLQAVADDAEAKMEGTNKTSLTLASYPDRLLADYYAINATLPSSQFLVGPTGSGGLVQKLKDLPTKGCVNCQGGAAYRSGVLASLQQLQSMVQRTPTHFSTPPSAVVATIDSMPDVHTSAASLRQLQSMLAKVPSQPQLPSQLSLLRSTLQQWAPGNLDDELHRLVDLPGNLSTASNILRRLSANLTPLDNLLVNFGPCISRIISQFQIIDATIARLPSTMEDLQAELVSVRDNVLVFPNFEGIQANVSNYMASVQALIPFVTTFLGQLPRLDSSINLVTQDTDFASLERSATTLVGGRPVLAPQAAQLDALAPSVEAVRAGAVNLSLASQQIEAVRQPLLGNLSAILSAPASRQGPLLLVAGGDLLTQCQLLAAAVPLLPPTVPQQLARAKTQLASLPDLSKALLDSMEQAHAAQALGNGTFRLELSALLASVDALPSLDWSTTLWDQMVSRLPGTPNIAPALDAAQRLPSVVLPQALNFTITQMYLDKAQNFLFESGPAMLARVAEAPIRASMVENGTVAAVKDVLWTIDQLSALVVDDPEMGTHLLNNSFIDTFLDRVAVVGNGRLAQHGSLLFLASIIDSKWFSSDGGTNELVVSPASGSGRDSGERQFCVSDACLNNTISLVFQAPAYEVAGQLFGTPLPNVLAVSLEVLLFALYVVPGLVVWLGVLSCSLRQPHLALAMLMVTIFLTPPLLLISGALQFPIALLAADLCTSAEAIISHLVNQTVPASQISVWQQQISLDVPAIAHYYLQATCSSDVNNDSNPASAMWQSAGDVLIPLLPDQVDSVVNRPDQYFRPQPGIEGIMRAGADNMSVTIRELIDAYQNITSCSKVSLAYYDIKNALCCGVVQSAQWYFASWYLIGLTLLLFGLPAGFLGCTYFSSWQRNIAMASPDIFATHHPPVATPQEQLVISQEPSLGGPGDWALTNLPHPSLDSSGAWRRESGPSRGRSFGQGSSCPDNPMPRMSTAVRSDPVLDAPADTVPSEVIGEGSRDASLGVSAVSLKRRTSRVSGVDRVVEGLVELQQSTTPRLE